MKRPGATRQKLAGGQPDWSILAAASCRAAEVRAGRTRERVVPDPIRIGIRPAKNDVINQLDVDGPRPREAGGFMRSDGLWNWTTARRTRRRKQRSRAAGYFT